MRLSERRFELAQNMPSESILSTPIDAERPMVRAERKTRACSRFAEAMPIDAERMEARRASEAQQSPLHVGRGIYVSL